MALLTLGNAPVLSGSLVRPLRGAWSADLEVDADAAPAGTLTLAGAGLSLVGTVVTSQSWNDRQRARIVGGKGGLGKVVGPAFYRSTTLRTVVSVLLSAVGETLSPTSDATTLATPIPVWVRLGGTAGACLDALLSVYAASALWRVLPDGSVYVGPATWPTVTSTAVVQDNRGDEDVADLAGEDLSLDAGVTVSGRKVGLARHRIRPAGLRSEAWWYTGAERGLAATVRTLVERIVGQRLDLLAAYPARVVSQNADGTLELVPYSSKLPALTRVPIRYGVPGVSAKVSAGARVLVEFEGGSSASPVATVWDVASVTEIAVTANVIKLAGERAVAYEGDAIVAMVDSATVKALYAAPVPISMPVTGYIVASTAKKVRGG